MARAQVKHFIDQRYRQILHTSGSSMSPVLVEQRERVHGVLVHKAAQVLEGRGENPGSLEGQCHVRG